MTVCLCRSFMGWGGRHHRWAYLCLLQPPEWVKDAGCTSVRSNVRARCTCPPASVSHRGVLCVLSTLLRGSHWHGDRCRTCLCVIFSSRAQSRPHSPLSESRPSRSVCREGLWPLEPPSCQPSRGFCAVVSGHCSCGERIFQRSPSLC